jgi:hypothetical protein
LLDLGPNGRLFLVTDQLVLNGRSANRQFNDTFAIIKQRVTLYVNQCQPSYDYGLLYQQLQITSTDPNLGVDE